MRRIVLLLICLLLPVAHAEDDAAWHALRQGGHVALIRHALAPGTFDPPEFKIGDCSTQRNLSDEGRAQARALGDKFRKHGVTNVALYSSEWCRCMDTATEMRLGPVTPFPPLNSLHHERSQGIDQTEAVRKLIREHKGDRTLVLVTHQFNISRLVDTAAGSGEVVVVRMEGDALKVIGRIE